MEELKKLVKEGKIKYIGLSEASPETMKAHAVHPVSAVQMEWSLWTRDIEEQIVPLLQVTTFNFRFQYAFCIKATSLICRSQIPCCCTFEYDFFLAVL